MSEHGQDNEDEYIPSFQQAEYSLLNASTTFIVSQHKERASTLYLLIILLFSLIIEFYARDYLKILSNHIFASGDKSRCLIYSYFDFYQYGGKYFLLFLIMNFVNIYASLAFLLVDCITLALGGFLRLIYLQPRPFWENEKIYPCKCIFGYSGPSAIAANIVVLFGSFYKSFTFKKTKKIWKKIFFGVICTILPIIILLVRMLQGVAYLHQIGLGAIIGASIHFCLYFIVKINLNDGRTFIGILNRPFLIIAIFLSICGIIYILHFNIDLKLKHDYLVNIQKHCNVENVYKMDNDSYSESLIIFQLLGCYLGVLMEYKISFKSSAETFTKYNIESRYLFNNTNICFKIIRFLLFYFLQVGVIKKFIFNKIYDYNFYNAPYYIKITFLYLPILLQGILYFFVMKRIIVYFKLTNEEIQNYSKKKQDNIYNNIIFQGDQNEEKELFDQNEEKELNEKNDENELNEKNDIIET